MIEEHHVVFDESALLAAGRGNVAASTLIHRAQHVYGWFVYVPTCVLVEADRFRPGVAEHVGMLRDVVVLDLDYSAALAVARDTNWAIAHARYSIAPSVDYPAGAEIATAEPERWKNVPVMVHDLTTK